eukprot:gene11931-8211_t
MAPFIPVTDLMVGITFALALLVTLDVVRPFQLFFSRALILEEKQYWRLVSCIFFTGRISFNLVAQLYWLYQLSKTVEQRYFHGHTVDYLFVILLGCGLILISRFLVFVEEPFLNGMLDSMIVYLGSRVLPNTQINLFFFIDIRLRYLPLLHAVVLASLGGLESAKEEIIGSAIGHVLWDKPDAGGVGHINLFNSNMDKKRTELCTKKQAERLSQRHYLWETPTYKGLNQQDVLNVSRITNEITTAQQMQINCNLRSVASLTYEHYPTLRLTSEKTKLSCPCFFIRLISLPLFYENREIKDDTVSNIPFLPSFPLSSTIANFKMGCFGSSAANPENNEEQANAAPQEENHSQHSGHSAAVADPYYPIGGWGPEKHRATVQKSCSLISCYFRHAFIAHYMHLYRFHLLVWLMETVRLGLPSAPHRPLSNPSPDFKMGCFGSSAANPENNEEQANAAPQEENHSQHSGHSAVADPYYPIGGWGPEKHRATVQKSCSLISCYFRHAFIAHYMHLYGFHLLVWLMETQHPLYGFSLSLSLSSPFLLDWPFDSSYLDCLPPPTVPFPTPLQTTKMGCFGSSESSDNHDPANAAPQEENHSQHSGHSGHSHGHSGHSHGSGHGSGHDEELKSKLSSTSRRLELNEYEGFSTVSVAISCLYEQSRFFLGSIWGATRELRL